MTRHQWFSLGFVIACTMLFGCAEDPTSTTYEPTRTVTAATAVIGERAFREISADFPEFAGYHFDENGNLVVKVVSSARVNQLTERVGVILEKRQRMQSWGARRQGGVRFETATHSYVDLDRWRNALRPAFLSVQGTVFLDLDEVRNQIVVGAIPSG